MYFFKIVSRVLIITVLVILPILLYWGCDFDCTGTKIVFKIAGYQTDMCPEPGGNCTMEGNFNYEYHFGGGMGSGYWN